ncbi:MAG TPA: flippase [Candidatus Dormibacteraeota bacterium]|nr:flippase [Candidatus Dormibacteraeota bacterium]
MPDHDPLPDLPAPSAGLGSRALRNTVLVLTAKVIARLVALVTVLAMIRYLNAAPYGAFATLVNYTAIVSVVLDLGFNVLFVREGARHPSEIQRYLRNVMSLRLLMSVVSLGLLAIALAANGLGSLLVPAFVLMVLTSYSTLLRNGLYAVQRLGYEAIAVVLESLVLLALVLFGIKTGRGLTYFVWAYAAQYAFSCAYFVVVLAVKRIAVIGWRFELPLLREWFWKGLPFALTFVLTILYFRIDQPLVYALRPHVEAGWYGAAYKPFEALLFIPMTFLSIVFPVLSIYHREGPGQLLDAVNRFFKALLLIGWPMSVGIFVLAHPLTRLLFGHGYEQSEPALRILALSLGFAFVNNAFIGALSATDHQASFTWAAGWSLLANLAMNLTLIPLFGYIGASWATVFTEIVLGAVGWTLTARHIGRVPVWRLGWRLVLAGLVMGAAVFPLRDMGGVAIAIPVVAGVAVYSVAVLRLRGLTRKEIDWARRALALSR